MPPSSSSNRSSEPTPFSIALIASATAGGLEPWLTYPMEYIKSVQQLRYSIRPSHLINTNHTTALEATTRSVLQAISDREGRQANKTANAEGIIQPRQYAGLLNTTKSIWQRDGLKGFYHGVGIVSLGGIAKSTIRMGTYDRLKKSLQMPDGSLSGGRSLIAGVGAGLAETLLVVVPSETIKTKVIHATLLPTNHPFQQISQSSFKAIHTLRDLGGGKLLYAGLTATLARQMASAMVRFGTYQSLKNIVGGSMRPGQKLPSGITFGLGAVSGMATVFTTMPFDVVKTRMQSLGARTRYRSTINCLVQIVREEGIRTLWRGSTMRLGRLTFSGAITFTVYEEITSLAGYD